MPSIDLLFPVQGAPVPLDHGYLLFSSLSRHLPVLHERKDVGVFNLRGKRMGKQLLQVDRGTLRLRCGADALSEILPLAGSTLELAGRELRLGMPTVYPLVATPTTLSARVVTFKHAMDEATFQASTMKFMAELGCSGTPYVGRRRVVSISGKKVVGFALTVSALSPESSLLLQERGLGGRRHMGCGLFLPSRLRVAL
ncbi:type I-MYXAN CRISPR-associated protein Cas6/Cmx6, partial [Myxococcus vastator]|uniref:type I-MYXAN CRISPR-associated protein Cas6/Cmx6 n=1 Tax=Myxococcus vastator TaxID=2709664 RepID=UPI0013D79E8B